MSKRIVISASSDIGFALASHWAEAGHQVGGTLRSASAATDELTKAGAFLVPCDLRDKRSVDDAARALAGRFQDWEVLVLAAGTTEPIGAFLDCDIDAWESSVMVNFLAQVRLVRLLLPFRRRAAKPLVLFFAGGGTNNATVNYSAYTVSKVALIKLCELLDAEIADTRFTILGPGWVRTKIHDETLNAGERAGANYQRTLQKLAGDEFAPMSRVIDCCDWLVSADREVVGGRNFSLAFDAWGSKGLEDALRQDPSLYKLRRFGNEQRGR